MNCEAMIAKKWKNVYGLICDYKISGFCEKVVQSYHFGYNFDEGLKNG